ncbi:Drug/metabolite transporter [Artemisia annua]|uniref:Drug/metabolite transporter n=1 Tax=Artemisia annua TaxID=35608 RepID=A0A2U1PDZ8_ARTAN|nr:Drug/metabolite transporter [Artemisia annua]
MRPKMTKSSIFIKLMLLALLEPVIGQIFYFLGMITKGGNLEQFTYELVNLGYKISLRDRAAAQTFLMYMQGIICSGLAYYIQGLIMKDRSPVFVTAFSPLNMIFVAIMGSIILAEKT